MKSFPVLLIVLFVASIFALTPTYAITHPALDGAAIATSCTGTTLVTTITTTVNNDLLIYAITGDNNGGANIGSAGITSSPSITWTFRENMSMPTFWSTYEWIAIWPSHGSITATANFNSGPPTDCGGILFAFTNPGNVPQSLIFDPSKSCPSIAFTGLQPCSYGDSGAGIKTISMGVNPIYPIPSLQSWVYVGIFGISNAQGWTAGSGMTAVTNVGSYTTFAEYAITTSTSFTVSASVGSLTFMGFIGDPLNLDSSQTGIFAGINLGIFVLSTLYVVLAVLMSIAVWDHKLTAKQFVISLTILTVAFVVLLALVVLFPV